jgi:hypothetical protein
MLKALERIFTRPQKSHVSNSAPLAVESLESREVLSAATFNVASAIVNSPENFNDFVTNEFTTLLRRAPDIQGLDFFVNRLEQGMSPEAVEAAFVSSSEYIFNHGNTPVGWLTGVYNDLLGRSPDPGGLNHWLMRMRAGETTFQAAGEIATSTERETIVIRQDYFSFLGRAADASGLNHWLILLQSGFTRAFVASAIVGSNEFFQTHGNTNSTFVVAAFSDVLGRTPSAGELTFFLGQLPNGTMSPVSMSVAASAAPMMMSA